MPSFEPAFTFGLDSLRRSMAEWWGVYIAIALLGAALTAWGATAQSFRTAQVEWIAVFPALATATRFARSSFKMTFARVCAIVLIGLLTFVLPLLLYIGSFFLIFKYIMATKAAWPILVIFLLFSALFWVVIKFALAPAFYALEADRDTNLLSAMSRSWASVSGPMWWRVLALGACVGLICGLVPGFVGIGVFFALKANPAAAAFVAALIYYGGSIPAYVWTTGSFVALATSLKPNPDPSLS